MSETIPTSSHERLYEETLGDPAQKLDPRELARRATTIIIEHEPTPDEIRRRQAMLAHFEREYEALDPDHSMLKAHQVDAIEGTYDFLMTPRPSDYGLTKRGLLAHAPGAGKSIYAAFVCSWLGVGKTLLPDQPPIRGLYLSNDVKGVSQTMGNDIIPRGFAKAAPWMDVEQLDVRTYSKRDKMPDAPMVGMTYYALVRRLRSHPTFFEGIDVLVADEAQFSTAPQTLTALQAIMPGKICFGLSGSAGKAGRLFPERIHRLSLREGIEERGILNSFVLMQCDTHQEILGSLTSKGDYKSQSLRYARESQPLRNQVRNIALALASHNYSTVIYTFPGGESDYAQKLASELDGQTVLESETDVDRPVRAQAIGAFQSSEKNRRAYEKFDQKELDILVTTRMGEIAWDPADLNAILLVCPSASFDAVLQRLGRGTRLSDKPTIVIHFEYDGPQQVSPYYVFGVEAQQGLMISRKDPLEDNQDGDEEKDTLDKEKDTTTERKPKKAGTLQDGDEIVIDQTVEHLTESVITPDHPEFGVFKHILGVLEAAELNLHKQRLFLRNGHEAVTFAETTTAAVLANKHNLDERLLVQLFRRGQHRFVSKDRPDGGRDVFCDTETSERFIEEQVAKPNTFTTAQMAMMLGTSQTWVQLHVDQAEAEIRYPRDSLNAQRAPHFPETVFARLLQEYETAAQPIRASEVTRMTLAERHGVDLITVHKWYEKKGIKPVYRFAMDERGETSRSPTLCFPSKYEAEFAWAVSAAPLPKGGNFRTIASAIEGSPVLRRMSHQQRVQVIEQAGVQPQRFKRHTNTNYFITGAEYDRLRSVANQTIVVPTSETISPSASAALIVEQLEQNGLTRFSEAFAQKAKEGGEVITPEPKPTPDQSVATLTTTSATESVAEQTTKPAANAPAVSKPKREPLALQNTLLLQEVAPVKDSERKQFLPILSLSYRANQGVATLVRTGSHIFSPDIFRRDPADNAILVREEYAEMLRQIFRDRRNKLRAVPHHWPVVNDVIDTFDLNTEQVFAWVREHHQSQQLHVLYTGKQPLVFCSVELMPFLLRSFKRDPTIKPRKR